MTAPREMRGRRAEMKNRPPKVCCPRCQNTGFRWGNGFNRPFFVCSRCDHKWHSGLTGEPYRSKAMNVEPIAEFVEKDAPHD